VPINLATAHTSGTVRELALKYIAEIPVGQAVTADEIAERAACHKRTVTERMNQYPWKLTVRTGSGRSAIVYMSKETYDAHQERAGSGQGNETAKRPRR